MDHYTQKLKSGGATLDQIKIDDLTHSRQVPALEKGDFKLTETPAIATVSVSSSYEYNMLETDLAFLN
jgi:hypothetical protein